MSNTTTEVRMAVSCPVNDYDKPKEMVVEKHPEPLFEVILETEIMNGIPVQTMATLINMESLVANLFRAARVHNRAASQFGSLPLTTIFQPVLSGCLCKGICHMEDVATVIRVMTNCLSRCGFVDHQCIKHLHNEMLHAVNAMTHWGLSISCNDDLTEMLKEYNKTALRRVTTFLRKLNEEMYDWRGFVRKPLPKKAPFNLFDITPIIPHVNVEHSEQQRGFFGWVPTICCGCSVTKNRVERTEQSTNRTTLC